jgi:hypothetical protein
METPTLSLKTRSTPGLASSIDVSPRRVWWITSAAPTCGQGKPCPYAGFVDGPRPSTQAATALDNIMTVPLLMLSTKVLAWEKKCDEE